MISIARSLTIAAPAGRVYAAYVDLDGWLGWVPHFREVEPVTNGPFGIGSQARIRTRLTPVPSIWEVTEVVPGRSFAWAYSGLPGLRLTVDHVVEPDGTGALATLRLDIQGPLSLAAAPLAAVMSRRNFDGSLAALKALVEGR